MYGINKYGEIRYGTNKKDITDDISMLAPNLIKYLPDYYKIKNDGLFWQIMNAISLQIGKLLYMYNDTNNQFSVDTATWGLSKWEEDYGITTNLSYSYESRRSVIKSKRVGTGTCTKKLIEDTAESFSGGEVQVEEHNSEGYFTVKFIGVLGIPKDLQSFKNMLEEIKPAHLNYVLSYTYTIWNLLKSDKLSWNSVIIKTWDDLKIYK